MNCCNRHAKRQGAIYYNPHNDVIQCHHCGHVYVPATKLQYLLNRIFRWWGN